MILLEHIFPEGQHPIAAPLSPAVKAGNLLFVSGTGPSQSAPKGKVDTDVSIEQAYGVAREVGLQLLATAKDALGDLDRIARIVKVLGMVNSSPEFDRQPEVINGCSDLLVEVLGDAGRHTRSAVGMAALPGRIAVEIECTFEVT